MTSKKKKKKKYTRWACFGLAAREESEVARPLAPL
jgi:hypothetical protein